jgi:hypothetical protein
VRGYRIRRIRSAAIALSLSLAACARTDKAPASDSAKAAAAPRAAKALVSTARSARTYPGALTRPIDAYSGDEFYDLTQQLKYAGSHERERRCKNSPDCDGTAPKKKTLVQVSAIATQDSLGAADVPQFGVVYVRAINKGDAEEARYGLRPGKSLRYYMIVNRDSAGALRWRLEELETGKPRRHAQIGTGSFQGCGHPWTPGARADFKTCNAAERGDTVVTMGLTMQPAVSDPMWVVCAVGCCIL